MYYTLGPGPCLYGNRSSGNYGPEARSGQVDCQQGLSLLWHRWPKPRLELAQTAYERLWQMRKYRQNPEQGFIPFGQSFQLYLFGHAGERGGTRPQINTDFCFRIKNSSVSICVHRVRGCYQPRTGGQKNTCPLLLFGDMSLSSARPRTNFARNFLQLFQAAQAILF